MNISKRMLSKLLLIGSLSLFVQLSSAKIRINELMQSNIDEVIDDYNEFPDSWVELYNDGETATDLKGWYISDDKNYIKGWQINASVIIPPKGYVLIYCDKTGDGIHADFRLESGKNAACYLFDPSGTKIDEVTKLAKQPAPGIACGREKDGSDTWCYFINATPGKSNNISDNVSETFAPDPVFSRKGGLFKEIVSLELSLPEGISQDIRPEHIFYTTNGSEPVPGTTGTFSYKNKINIYGSQVVRAKIIAPGYLIPRSVAQSYIIRNRTFTLPVISIGLNDSYINDPDFGIYVDGSGKNGIANSCINKKVNWNQNWRRPMNIEYFPTETSTSVINQLGEMRIAGGCTRVNPQKSLILYSNKRFGENKRYDYQFFDEKPNQEIKSFMLRNSGNDFGSTHIRDAAIQSFLGGKVNLDYQAYQPAILYINGTYFGIQNIRERSDEDFVLANYNGLEDIDMYEISWDEGVVLKAGDAEAYTQMSERIKAPSAQLTYEELASFTDIDEYINYNIIQIYVANTDFPHNNVVLWRPKTPGGKWRFILKDTDFGLGLYGNTPAHKTMAYATEIKDHTRLFRRLLDKEPFKEEFIKRFAVYMGDMLNKESTAYVIDSLKQKVQEEMPHHMQRFNLKNNWDDNVNSLKTWCAARNNHMYSELNSHFKLKGIALMTLDVPESMQHSASLSVNGIPLQKPHFNGKYFRGKNVHIQWNGDIPSSAKGWNVVYTTAGKESSIDVYDTGIDFLIPDNCTKVAFSVITEGSGFHRIGNSTVQFESFEKNILISNITEEADISLYDLAGHLLTTARTNESFVSVPSEKGVYIIHVRSANSVNSGKVFVK